MRPQYKSLFGFLIFVIATLSVCAMVIDTHPSFTTICCALEMTLIYLGVGYLRYVFAKYNRISRLNGLYEMVSEMNEFREQYIEIKLDQVNDKVHLEFNDHPIIYMDDRWVKSLSKLERKFVVHWMVYFNSYYNGGGAISTDKELCFSFADDHAIKDCVTNHASSKKIWSFVFGQMLTTPMGQGFDSSRANAIRLSLQKFLN